MLDWSSLVTAITASADDTFASSIISGSRTSPFKTTDLLRLRATISARDLSASITLIFTGCSASICCAKNKPIFPPPKITMRRASGSS